MTTADGDVERFEQLFRRYYKRVVSFLMHMGFSLDDARDLAQDTFLRVYKRMDAYRGDAEWTFLKTAAHNLARNRWRDDAALKRKSERVSIDDVLDPGDPAPLADDALATREETAHFRERYATAIDALPDGARRPFLLREQGYSYEEIAKILEVPMNSVKSRLHDAKRRLREQLGTEPLGIDWPEAAGDRRG